MTDNELAKHKVDDKIGKWYNVKVETYTIIYALAKERFDDTLNEVASVTDKSIKMATGLLIFTGFFVGQLIIHMNLVKLHITLLLISGACVLAELITLAILLYPKSVKAPGISPQNAIPKDIDNPEDADYQQQLIYYNAIVDLEEKIIYMNSHNEKRVKYYKVAIISFLFLIPFVSIVAVYVLS